MSLRLVASIVSGDIGARATICPFTKAVRVALICSFSALLLAIVVPYVVRVSRGDPTPDPDLYSIQTSAG